jgi:serine/threonine protein kinase
MSNHRVFSVNAEPFAVPSQYTIVRGEYGGSQHAHVVRVHVTPAGASSPVELKIRRFPRVLDATVTTPAERALFLRFVKLHTNLHADFPNVVPIVDLYQSKLTPGDVYCAFPATRYTLADAAASGDMSADQITVITRYLIRCLRLFHLNNIAVTNLRPESIAISPDLTDPDSVQISDLFRCVAVPPSVKRPVLPAAAAAVATASFAAAPSDAGAKPNASPPRTVSVAHGALSAAAAKAAAATVTSVGSDAAALGAAVAGQIGISNARLDDGIAIHSVADRFAMPRGVNAAIIPPAMLATTANWYTAPEIVLGAPARVPPSQRAAAGDAPTHGNASVVVTAAADLWTLGCIVYELATKQPLFPAVDKESYVDMLADLFGSEPDYVAALGNTPWVRHLQQSSTGRTASTLAARLAGVDLRVRYLVARLLCVNPKDRGTCQDLMKLPYFGGDAVNMAHLVGPPPGAPGSSKVGSTSTQRAAEERAAAAAASAPLILADSEFIAPDWAIPIDASPELLADEVTALFAPRINYD